MRSCFALAFRLERRASCKAAGMSVPRSSATTTSGRSRSRARAPLASRSSVPLRLRPRVKGRPASEDGYFVAPAIVTDFDPHHPLAQEEIFGPLLCVFTVPEFEQAIEFADDTPYGLTGGVFSRSPAHLEYARREFRVG